MINGSHLAGRELGASALQLPLFASVALHSQRECVFVFEAPPPPSLAACFAGNLVNTAGATVKLGTDRGFTHLFYCGQRSAPRAAGAETYAEGDMRRAQMRGYWRLLSWYEVGGWCVWVLGVWPR